MALLATAVPWRVNEVLVVAATKAFAADEEKQNLEQLKKIGAGHNTPRLVEIGETDFYVVNDSRNPSVEHDWAHVKHFNANKAGESGDTSSGRIRSGQRLMREVRQEKHGTKYNGH